jgi:NAD(P)H-hydrate epimerase
LRQLEKALLLDADALRALGLIRKKLFHSQTVLTPHSGEFKAISGKAPATDLQNRSNEVRTVAERSGSITLLKGNTDVISDGRRVRFNRTGNPGMTVGGTGDVLAGIISGLMAQGIDAFRAAGAGAFINGAAGDLAQEEYGPHLTSTDLVERIPKVMTNPMGHKPIFEKRIG